jgi:hypothetical protein
MTTFIIPDKSAVATVDPDVDVFPVWQGAGQRKATARQIVSAVGPQLMSSNTTINVRSSGGDFTTVQAALDSLNAYQISPRAVVTLQLAEETLTHTAPIMKDGPFGMYTYIKGVVYTRNVTSVQSSSGSTGAWSIVLNMNSVANVAVNDYIGLVTPSGGTLPTYLAGCHKITNVDAVNTRITITSTHRAATAPSGAIACVGTVFKSILSFAGVDGIRVWSGASTINLQDVCVVGTTTAGTNGLSIQDGGGRLYVEGVVGVSGFNVGVYGTYNVEINGDGDLIASSASGAAINADAGTFITSTNIVASGSGTYGIVSSNGGIVVANDSIITGNALDGAIANSCGSMRLGNTSVTGNLRWGINADTISNIAVDSVTVSNNVRGSYASRGLTGLDGNSIFTDQSYGNNLTVTPDGHNIFIGWGAGSANCGSTATATNEGSANTGVGQYATNSLTTGYMNAGIGYAALSSLTTGYNNVGIGQKAGQKITGGSTNNVTSYNSTYVGALTRASADGNANETVIGYAVTGNGANTVTIGNASVTATYLMGVVSASSYTASATITGALTKGAYSYGTIPYSATGCFASYNLSANSYSQVVISNSSNAAVASANLIVSNDLGTDATYYGSFGINSSGFTGAGALNLPNSTYLSCISGDLAIGTQDAHAIHFVANAAATDAMTISSANIPTINSPVLVDPKLGSTLANGQSLAVKSLTELTTIAAAATTTTTIQIPGNAIVLAVSVYVQTAIPTATTFTVGDSGSAARYSTAAVSVNLGSSDKGTKAGAYYNASALGILITPNGTPAANTGRVRVTIHYIEVTVPTS